MRDSGLLRVGLALAALGTIAGCRSAGGPKAVTPPGFTADFAAAYQGQARILAGLGDKSKLSIAAGAVLKKGGCDVAVLVTSAALEGGTARLAMEPVGLPKIEMRPAARPCEKPAKSYTLAVSGLDARASLPALQEEIDRVIETPERFLADRGVAYAQKAATPDPVADLRLKAKPEERMLARAITKPCQRLLTVTPIRRDDRKAVRYRGEVPFEGVVGSDGRLRDARLLVSLAGHNERVLKALELWRYEPARKGDQAVSFRMEERTVFRIY